MKQVGDGEVTIEDGNVTTHGTNAWAEEYLANPVREDPDGVAQSWADEHVANRDDEYNSEFWHKLQDEWKALAEQDSADHPWISDFNEYYDSYKVLFQFRSTLCVYYNFDFQDYIFSETNPMFDILNPMQRGKEYLEAGDLPSAVLCFEAAVKKEPENVEAWQLLGTTQAENEQVS